MKIKSIPNDVNIKRTFFLLMIAPLLIGVMISLTSLAHAEWNKDDPLLNKSPKKQGWQQIQIHKESSKVEKIKEGSTKVSSN